MDAIGRRRQHTHMD